VISLTQTQKDGTVIMKYVNQHNIRYYYIDRDMIRIMFDRKTILMVDNSKENWKALGFSTGNPDTIWKEM
jgi:hypothetical protein